jgi:hypothetical protein
LLTKIRCTATAAATTLVSNDTQIARPEETLKGKEPLASCRLEHPGLPIRKNRFPNSRIKIMRPIKTSAQSGEAFGSAKVRLGDFH